LEEDEAVLADTFNRIKDGLIEYFASDKAIANSQKNMNKVVS
jgi:hypothetical protein